MRKIMRLGLLCFGLMLVQSAQGQTDSLLIRKDSLTIDTVQIKIDVKVYQDVDVQGEYKGSPDSLYEHAGITFNMPIVAMELGISGMVFIQFVVEKNGEVTNVRAIAPKERQLGYGLEEECIRVVKLTSGQWTPAQKDGKPVRSYCRFPFEIDNSSGFGRPRKKKRR